MKKRHKICSVLCAATLLLSSFNAFAAEEVVYVTGEETETEADEVVEIGENGEVLDSQMETLLFSLNKKVLSAKTGIGIFAAKPKTETTVTRILESELTADTKIEGTAVIVFQQKEAEEQTETETQSKIQSTEIANSQPVSKSMQAGAESQSAGAESKSIQTEAKDTQTESKSIQAGTESTKIESESTQIESETTQKQSETTQKQSETTQKQSETTQESETEPAKQSRVLTKEEADKAGLPQIGLTQEQQELVRETAKLASETIVMTNRCTLEDELIFKDNSKVKAVCTVNESTDEDLAEVLETIDLKVCAQNYQQLMKKAQEPAQTESTKQQVAKSGTSTEKTDNAKQTESTKQSESSKQTEKQSESNAKPKAGSSGSLNKANSQSESGDEPESGTDTPTTSKDVTFTLVPIDVYEGDDQINVEYEIACSKELTKGKVTVSFDENIMTFDSATAGDTMENMATNSNGDDGIPSTSVKDGKIEFTFSSDTATKLDGTILDVYWKLKDKAKLTDTYNVNLTVDELKNGTTDLTYKVEEGPIKVQVWEDEEDTQEEQSETQKTTQAPQSESTKQTTKAAKTADTTDITLWAVLMIGALAAGYGCSRKQRSKYNR